MNDNLINFYYLLNYHRLQEECGMYRKLKMLQLLTDKKSGNKEFLVLHFCCGGYLMLLSDAVKFSIQH